MSDYLGEQFGNYHLVELLGEGSFAQVYRGEHIQLGNKAQVAIKVLTIKLTEERLAQFRQEALTIMELEHSHIVRVLDFGMEGRTPYIIMNYAPKGSLRNLHPIGTRLSQQTVVVYVKQIASALQFAHDRKLIHRDVKPDNMLIGRNDDVLLSDFGIATVAHGTQSLYTRDNPGSPYYNAPEQILGKPRPASDQYALGVIVYEWLTGTWPFDGSSQIEIAMKHVQEPPPSLRKRVPTISIEVEQVVLKALAKEPDNRYPSVQAFSVALEQAVTQATKAAVKPVNPLPPKSLSPIPQPIKPNPPVPLQRPITRRQAIAGLAVLTALSLAGGTLYILMPKPIYTYHGHGHSDQPYHTVNAVAWSPDGKRLASASDDFTVQVWDATTGNNSFTYHGHSGFVYKVVWSPDGKRIASGSGDSTVQVWDATTGNNSFTYLGHAHTDGVNAVAWSPDGTFIASGGYDKTVQVWEAATGKQTYTYHGHSHSDSGVWSIAWSPNNTRIASGDDSTVQVWDAVDGSNVFTYHGHSDIVRAVGWSLDGKRIASASSDKTVQVWDAIDGSNVFTYRGHSSLIWSMAWSPDGKRIASSANDSVQVWDAVDGSNVHTYGSTNNLAVEWSPDSRLIAIGVDDEVQVWETP